MRTLAHTTVKQQFAVKSLHYDYKFITTGAHLAQSFTNVARNKHINSAHFFHSFCCSSGLLIQEMASIERDR